MLAQHPADRLDTPPQATVALGMNSDGTCPPTPTSPRRGVRWRSRILASGFDSRQWPEPVDDDGENVLVGPAELLTDVWVSTVTRARTSLVVTSRRIVPDACAWLSRAATASVKTSVGVAIARSEICAGSRKRTVVHEQASSARARRKANSPRSGLGRDSVPTSAWQFLQGLLHQHDEKVLLGGEVFEYGPYGDPGTAGHFLGRCSDAALGEYHVSGSQDHVPVAVGITAGRD